VYIADQLHVLMQCTLVCSPSVLFLLEIS